MANDNPTEQTHNMTRKFLTEEELDALVREQDEESDDKPLSDNRGRAYAPPRSESTQKAFKYLEDLLLDDNSTSTDRMTAARIILDHAHL